MTDPVCGMEVAPEKAAGSRRHEGETYYFCSRKCAEKFAADPERWLHPAELRRGGGRRRGQRGDLHLPDAPGGRPAGPRRLPDLRHGAGTAGAHRRRGGERGIPRHAPAFPLQRHSYRPRLHHRHGACASPASATSSRPASPPGFSSSSPRPSSSGAAGSFSCAAGSRWSAATSTCSPSSPWGRGRLGLQRRRRLRSRPFPPLLPRRGRRGRRLFRGGGGDRHPGPARPGAGTARPQPHRGGHPRAARAGAEDRPPPAGGRLGGGVPLESVRKGDRLRIRPGEKVPMDGAVDGGTAMWTNR